MSGAGAPQMTAATLMAGGLAGVGAVGFHFLADRFGEALFAWAGRALAHSPFPPALVVPTVGLCLIGIFLQLIPASRSGGVGEVVDALDRQGGRVPVARILNVIASGLVLAVGGSVGPEGPMVQLGALAGSLSGRCFGLSGPQLAVLTRAGAGAGIAAAFRSPAGGVLLTLEILGARFNRSLVPVAVAAGLAYLLRTAILADAFPFRPAVGLQPLPTLTLVTLVPLMGLAAAPAGHFFIWLFQRWKAVLPAGWPLWVRVTMGGGLVGTIGIWYPQVLSAGYGTILAGLHGEIGFELFIALLVLKMLATAITFGTGAVGGLFAPTLVIGSLFGGAFGYGFERLMPGAAPQPALFVLLGMIVMFGSIVKGYWSGLLMIADLSGCYHELLLPGLIAGGISFLVSWELGDRSIFGLKLEPPAGTERPAWPRGEEKRAAAPPVFAVRNLIGEGSDAN